MRVWGFGIHAGLGFSCSEVGGFSSSLALDSRRFQVYFAIQPEPETLNRHTMWFGCGAGRLGQAVSAGDILNTKPLQAV